MWKIALTSSNINNSLKFKNYLFLVKVTGRDCRYKVSSNIFFIYIYDTITAALLRDHKNVF